MLRGSLFHCHHHHYLLLLFVCAVYVLLAATCASGNTIPTKVPKSRQRPLQLSEKLLKMLNEHFHTFGRPRFGKRAFTQDDWALLQSPRGDLVWNEDFEEFLHTLPPKPTVPVIFYTSKGDIDEMETQEGRLQKPLVLDYN